MRVDTGPGSVGRPGPEYDAATLIETAEAALNASTLLWGVLFGSIGLGFFIYGRKQRAIVPLACGLALMVFPYFVSGSVPLVVIGAVLMAMPYFIRL